MQVDPIYVLSHVIIGEMIISRVTQQPLRPHYYSRCAHMYKAMSDLLSDEDATFHRKVWSLIQLAMLERTAQKPKLQAMHMQALDDFIESRGGVTALLSYEERDDPVYLNCRLFAAQFVSSEVQIPTFRQFENIKARFLLSLHRIQSWTSMLHGRDTSTSQDNPFSNADSLRKLNPITNYLHHLIEKWLSDNESPDSFQNNSGAFFCSFSLAMTFVESEASPQAAFDYLHKAQNFMSASTTVQSQLGKELDNLHPAAAAHIFGAVRLEDFPDGGIAREIKISQALIDAHKAFMLLSDERRIEMTTWLVECVLSCTKSQVQEKAESVLFDQKRLKALETEVDYAWWSARTKKKTTRQKWCKPYSPRATT